MPLIDAILNGAGLLSKGGEAVSSAHRGDDTKSIVSVGRMALSVAGMVTEFSPLGTVSDIAGIAESVISSKYADAAYNTVKTGAKRGCQLSLAADAAGVLTVGVSEVASVPATVVTCGAYGALEAGSMIKSYLTVTEHRAAPTSVTQAVTEPHPDNITPPKQPAAPKPDSPQAPAQVQPSSSGSERYKANPNYGKLEHQPPKQCIADEITRDTGLPREQVAADGAALERRIKEDQHKNAEAKAAGLPPHSRCVGTGDQRIHAKVAELGTQMQEHVTGYQADQAFTAQPYVVTPAARTPAIV